MLNNKKKILVLGGGFGGTYAIKSLVEKFHGRDDIELGMITRDNFFMFTPLLHEVATGGLSAQNIATPLRKVFGSKLNTFCLATVEGLDLEKEEVTTNLGKYTYDYLVMGLGAGNNFYGTVGARENAFTLKTMEDALELKDHFITSIEKAAHLIDEEEIKKLLRFVVIGGGPTGVELAAEISDLFYETFAGYYDPTLLAFVEILVLNRGDKLVAQFPEYFQKKSLEVLTNKKVKVRFGVGVTEVGADFVVLDTNEKIETYTPMWMAGISPAKFKLEEDTVKNERGNLIVNKYLQLEKHENVFVVGDLAGFTNPGEERPVPALAQVATKQGKAVAGNIEHLIENTPLQPFFYKSDGTMMSLGKWMALANVGKFNFSGPFAWIIWHSVYLMKQISWSKKFRLAFEWFLYLFTPRDIAQFKSNCPPCKK